VVVPPSNHYSGKERHWLVSPQDANPAPCPAWLLDAIKEYQVKEAKDSIIPDVIIDGKRNKTLFSQVAGRLRNIGLEQNEIRAALEEVNKRCDPPLPMSEIATIAKSICRYEPGTLDVWSIPPAEEAHDGGQLQPAVVVAEGSTWEDMESHLGPISWAWDGWLPNGFLTLVAGEPGQGKSVLCLRIAATYLGARSWPGGAAYKGDPGAVLWCESEAAQALNLERAKAWGLPLDMMYTPLSNPLEDVELGKSEHQEAITSLAHRPEVKLVIVDSLRGAHRHDENSSVLMEVTRWLAELARNTGKPILLTHHLRKRGMLDVGDRVTLDRIRGSSAIIQTARMCWALDAPDPMEEESKRLSVIKSNLARFPDPMGFTIGNEARLTFGDAPEAPREDSPMERATDLLMALLSDKPMRQPEIEEEAKGAGISWGTIRRAKDKLNVVSKRQEGKWYWALPARDYTH
jgi:putative DNA primase/helicase